VWLLQPRPIDIGRLRIIPAQASAAPNVLTSASQPVALISWLPPSGGRQGTAVASAKEERRSHPNDFSGSEALRHEALKPTLRLVDANAFGTGLHPTTGLCLEALQEAVDTVRPEAVLDVGTGSGLLALGALALGVPGALGIDIDDEALRVAAENARINALHDRLRLSPGGPEAVAGAWPLVLANVLAASLIEMAPALVRRVGRQGRLVLSGIPAGVEPEVEQAYRDLGMRRVEVKSRNGWVALVLQASW
jgi:ribosomal protein L11 methylase PrmA